MSSSTLSSTRSSACGCTEVKTEELTHEWIIKKFSFLPQGNGQGICSPMFQTVNNDIRWRLWLFPQGATEECNNYVAVGLHSHWGKKIEILAHVEISILPIGITRKFIDNKYEGITSLRFPRRVQRSSLLKSCAADDTVTIRCKIEIPRETVTNSMDITKSREEALDCQRGQLSQDFYLLLTRSKFSDVTIIVEDKKFPAHKVVLAAHSPIFSAMFENKGTRDNLENGVKIENMESVVVEAMLESFYTDKVTNLDELAYGLLEAVDKYDIQRLRSICEKFIYKTINNDNAAEILVHADLHGSIKFREYVMEFMADHLLEVVESESYKKMVTKYPALLKELIDLYALRQKSKKRKLAWS